MSEMLSQAEIDALLNGTADFEDTSQEQEDIDFSPEEADALGEIGNISMGTSATTLFTLLGQKVLITTPKISVSSWEELSEHHDIPYVAVKVEYTEGLKGTNLLILKEEDVKVITDLMMGGDGTNKSGELSELHISAIGEAMNQMIGSASTSMSSMFNKIIDISPPNAFVVNFKNDKPFGEFDYKKKIIKIAFRMVVGDLIDSEIMQLIPIDFAKSLVSTLLESGEEDVQEEEPKPVQTVQAEPIITPRHEDQPTAPKDIGIRQQGTVTNNEKQKSVNHNTPISVQPVQFQAFEETGSGADRENISLIMDVPLEVTVELGRTQRLIKDILEFAPGSIIELDKLAGEPIDILVNGKLIAKGEVVVIDESFGVRIAEIVSPSKRL